MTTVFKCTEQIQIFQKLNRCAPSYKILECLKLTLGSFDFAHGKFRALPKAVGAAKFSRIFLIREESTRCTYVKTSMGQLFAHWEILRI